MIRKQFYRDKHIFAESDHLDKDIAEANTKKTQFSSAKAIAEVNFAGWVNRSFLGPKSILLNSKSVHYLLQKLYLMIAIKEWFKLAVLDF